MRTIARRIRAIEHAQPKVRLHTVVEHARRRWREDPAGMRAESDKRRAAFVAWAEAERSAGRALPPAAERVLSVMRRCEAGA